jgi:hypothetical protein
MQRLLAQLSEQCIKTSNEKTYRFLSTPLSNVQRGDESNRYAGALTWHSYVQREGEH